MDAVQTDNGICVQALKQQKPRLLLPMIGFLVLVIWGLAATRNLEDSTEFQMSDRRVTPFLQGFYAPETATDGTTYRWTNGLGVIQAQSIRATTHALWRVSVAASPTPLALYLDGLQVLHQQRRIYQVIGATPSWTGAHELRINTIPFADPNEERLLGVRVTDATLVQSGGRLPALFWLGSVFVILACLVTSALVLGWGMGGVVGATVIAALITSSAPLLDVRAAGTWMFTLASLEHYQFIGGPFFNSLYSNSEPLLWLSTDPVMLDSLLRDRMNALRKKGGFVDISDEIRTLEFAESLGVGSTKTKSVKIVPLD